jgi:hypothetical protein
MYMVGSFEAAQHTIPVTSVSLFQFQYWKCTDAPDGCSTLIAFRFIYWKPKLIFAKFITVQKPHYVEW